LPKPENVIRDSFSLPAHITKKPHVKLHIYKFFFGCQKLFLKTSRNTYHQANVIKTELETLKLPIFNSFNNTKYSPTSLVG